ncbi:MAG: hypothetical protein Q617_SPSC00040G0001 [Streptococcus sp. DORA_10]|nr:MAG: hypothetical protein Q617_SPSC00040G0001 [Streptococcus sp. DORA_10]
MNWQIIWNHFQKTNKKESRSLWTIRIKMIRQTKKIIMKRTLIKQTLLLAIKKSNWEIMEGIIGKKKAKEVRRSLGGENTYVPKEGEEDDIKARNDKIYEKFLSGKSIKELAREYSMTTKWIRNILKSYEQSRNEENDDNINRN